MKGKRSQYCYLKLISVLQTGWVGSGVDLARLSWRPPRKNRSSGAYIALKCSEIYCTRSLGASFSLEGPVRTKNSSSLPLTFK